MEASYDHFMNAISENDLRCIKCYLNQGLNVNKVCSNGMTLLGAAAKTGNLSILKALTEPTSSNFSLDFANENCLESSYLDLSSEKRLKNIGYFIVRRDVEENEFGEGPTPDGMEDLEWDMEVTQGSETEDPNSDMNIYKWYAQILNKTSTILESPDHDIARLDRHGQNILHYAIRSGNLEMVEYLMKTFSEINVNQCDASWFSPLHLAVFNGNITLVKFLIGAGADVYMVNRDRQTPLHIAAQNGFTNILSLLIERGANINALDLEDRSPLTLAALNNQVDSVQILVQKGARLNIEEANGFTPLRRAVWNNSTTITKILLEGGSHIVQSHYLLQTASRNNNLEIVRALHKAGAILNVRDDQGNSPLMVACSRKNVQIAKYLLRHGASANTINHINGMTALHICVQDIREPRSLYQFIDLLVSYGANMNAYSFQGSVLFYAIILENLPGACALVRHGVDVNMKDERAYFDNLSLAKRHGNLELVRMIVYAGFNFSNMVFHFSSVKTQSNDPICNFLDEARKNPLKLKELCRIRVRKCLRGYIIPKIKQLSLPITLHKYLALEIL